MFIMTEELYKVLPDGEQITGVYLPLQPDLNLVDDEFITSSTNLSDVYCSLSSDGSFVSFKPGYFINRSDGLGVVLEVDLKNNSKSRTFVELVWDKAKSNGFVDFLVSESDKAFQKIGEEVFIPKHFNSWIWLDKAEVKALVREFLVYEDLAEKKFKTAGEVIERWASASNHLVFLAEKDLRSQYIPGYGPRAFWNNFMLYSFDA